MEEKETRYDSAYKYLFSNKRIFHQFLTKFVHEDFSKSIRLEDIELVDKSFVSDEFVKRESDIIYKMKAEEKDVYIYVLVEFQSTVDKTIPVGKFAISIELVCFWLFSPVVVLWIREEVFLKF